MGPAWIAAICITALAVTGIGAALVLRPGNDPTNQAQGSRLSSAVQATPRTSVAPAMPAIPAIPAPRTVELLPDGLFCRDLFARGYSYVAAVHYWRLRGEPNRMDVDRNGVPCETVYSPSDIEAYWGARIG